MKRMLLPAVLVLVLLPNLVAAHCGADHTSAQATMSCADGTNYDADVNRCVPSTS